MRKNNLKSQHQQSKDKLKNTHLIISEKKNGSFLYIIIAFCLPVFLYLQTINFGFTNYDDDRIILNNITFLSDFGTVHQVFLTDAFIGKFVPFYRPLQTLSLMADIKLSGKNNTWAYHLSNILLLGFIACFLFFMLRQFFIPQKLALISTLIYCAHPLFISFIAWIPARGDLLLVFFSLLSFLFFIQFLKKGKFLYLFLNWASFTIALFCKETAAFLPVIFILYYFTFFFEKHFKIKYLINILLWIISGIFWIWLRSKAISGTLNSKDESVVGLIPLLSNLRTIPESLSNFFLPFESELIPVFSIFKTLAGLVIISIIIIIFFKNREKSKKEKIFCFSWFLILILPPMLYSDVNTDYFNHRFFLPLIGILLFVLFIFPKKWVEIVEVKRYWLMIAIFVFFCVLTFIQYRSYSNPLAFYNSAISQNPNSSMAYCNRGLVKYKRNNFQGAIEDFNKAIAIKPNNSEAYINKGVIKTKMGDNIGAIEDYNKAIVYNPKSDQAYYNIGVLKAKMGNYFEAIEDYNKVIAINPWFDQVYSDRGISKANMGDNLGAINDFNKAININPGYDQAYCNRGFAKTRMGNNLEAIEDFNKAIAINPGNDQAYCNRGFAKAIIGDNFQAIEDYNKAIAINPTFILAYENRAVSKYRLKDLTGAIEDCKNVLKLVPNDEKSLNFKTKIQRELQKLK